MEIQLMNCNLVIIGKEQFVEALKVCTIAKSHLLFASMLLLGGCSPALPDRHLPETHPVAGQVVKKSGEAFTNSSVEFQSKDDMGQRAVGSIQPDGSFVLKTIAHNVVLEGAVAGEYEVTIHSIDEGSHAPQSVVLTEHQTIVSGENRLTLLLP